MAVTTAVAKERYLNTYNNGDDDDDGGGGRKHSNHDVNNSYAPLFPSLLI